MGFLINPSRFVIPCDPEMWSQTSGSGEVGFNSTGVIGVANNISAGNANIGKTLTSFKMYMKRTNTSSQPLAFGVWSYTNNTLSPTTTFTGSITNANQLTTSYAWYTWTGSHTLAQNDHIGFCTQSGFGTNLGVARVDNVGELTVDDMTLTVKSTTGVWWNYSASQTSYQEGFQTC